MKTLQFNKTIVIETIEKNMRKHELEFSEAWTEYCRTSALKFKQLADAAEKGKQFENHTGLIKPSSHVDDYERILAMLKTCSDTNVELNQEEFARYMQDEWEWQSQFKYTNSLYLSNK